MNKLLAIAVSLALAMSVSTPAFAAFTVDGGVAKTAVVNVGGEPGRIITLGVRVKNVSDNKLTVGGQVAWSGVNAGALDWKAADQYLDVTGFETYSHWGIQIFTNNLVGGANPADPQYTGEGSPAGLVNATDTTSALPMCWRVAVNSNIRDGRLVAGSDDLKMQEKYIGATEDTVILRVPADYVSDTDYYAPWFWMLDKHDLDPKTIGRQENYGTYASFIDSGRIQAAPSEYFAIPTREARYCVYLGAKFTGAAAGVQYKTNKLTVQMYHL